MATGQPKRRKGRKMLKGKILRDDFFNTKKWFIGDPETNFKWHVDGYKTRKAAVDAAAACDARVIE